MRWILHSDTRLRTWSATSGMGSALNSRPAEAPARQTVCGRTDGSGPGKAPRPAYRSEYQQFHDAKFARGRPPEPGSPGLVASPGRRACQGAPRPSPPAHCATTRRGVIGCGRSGSGRCGAVLDDAAEQASPARSRQPRTDCRGDRSDERSAPRARWGLGVRARARATVSTHPLTQRLSRLDATPHGRWGRTERAHG